MSWAEHHCNHSRGDEIIMKNFLIVTAFALSSTVANAACPSGYTSYGPFCAFEPSLPADDGKPAAQNGVRKDRNQSADRIGRGDFDNSHFHRAGGNMTIATESLRDTARNPAAER
jgi:hypothetical protein